MDILLQFILYYSKFVPKPALNKLFVQPASTQRAGYSELQADMLSSPSVDVIPEIEYFAFSLNEKYLSDSIRNVKGFVLFIEYGEVLSFTPIAQGGVCEKIGISVSHEASIANNDSINETLLMNQAYNILIKILLTMYRDKKNPDNCPVDTIIDFPAKIYPVEGLYFFDHCGWSAVFERSNSIFNEKP
jgi:hypothetical protein